MSGRRGFDACRVAVVTGGGHGIGRALSRVLAGIAETVVVADRDGDAARTVAKEFNGVARTLDVSVEPELVLLIEEIERDFAPIDLFVSNAGVGFGDGPSGAAAPDGRFGEPADRWAACWSVNVMAHVYAARHLVPRMRARGGGYLVSTASAAGLLCQIGDAAYTATKHAAVAFAESLAITHGDEGIQVSVVCPQAVATRMIGMPDDSEGTRGGFGGNDVDGILRAEDAAAMIVDGVRAGRFLILTHPEVATYLERKAGDRDRWIRGMQRFRDRLATKESGG
jgi:NAD(P)-dependent dehydrogenase (short-subunit alcohol dehydrogenase family)